MASFEVDGAVVCRPCPLRSLMACSLSMPCGVGQLQFRRCNTVICTAGASLAQHTPNPSSCPARRDDACQPSFAELGKPPLQGDNDFTAEDLQKPAKPRDRHQDMLWHYVQTAARAKASRPGTLCSASLRCDVRGVSDMSQGVTECLGRIARLRMHLGLHAGLVSASGTV